MNEEQPAALYEAYFTRPAQTAGSLNGYVDRARDREQARLAGLQKERDAWNRDVDARKRAKKARRG